MEFIIILLGIISFMIIHFYQKQKNNALILTLQEDINKYNIGSTFQKLELDTKTHMIEENESERKRVIHELHENIGNKIVAAKMQFRSIKNDLVMNSLPYQQCDRLLEEVVNETRQLAYKISNKDINDFSIKSALSDIKHLLEHQNGINLDIYYHGLENSLSCEINLKLFHMVQELITNILTHANAKQITLQLSRLKEELILTVEDDGVGFDTQRINFISRNGFGLKGIEENLVSINGKFFIDSTPGHGTTVTIEIPLAA